MLVMGFSVLVCDLLLGVFCWLFTFCLLDVCLLCICVWWLFDSGFVLVYLLLFWLNVAVLLGVVFVICVGCDFGFAFWVLIGMWILLVGYLFLLVLFCCYVFGCRLLLLLGFGC